MVAFRCWCITKVLNIHKIKIILKKILINPGGDFNPVPAARSLVLVIVVGREGSVPFPSYADRWW
jgi:hypothetical protein